MLSHVPGLQTYNSKQPFSLVNGVAVQIYRQASKLKEKPKIEFLQINVGVEQDHDLNKGIMLEFDSMGTSHNISSHNGNGLYF